MTTIKNWCTKCEKLVDMEVTLSGEGDDMKVERKCLSCGRITHDVTKKFNKIFGKKK